VKKDNPVKKADLLPALKGEGFLRAVHWFPIYSGLHLSSGGSWDDQRSPRSPSSWAPTNRNPRRFVNLHSHPEGARLSVVTSKTPAKRSSIELKRKEDIPAQAEL
jgi:hypothetical protein